jgi:hypothetical protein
MNKNSVKIIKDQEGSYYLLGPNWTKVKIEKSLDHAWIQLENTIQENIDFLKKSGVEDETETFSLSSYFFKKEWKKSLVNGFFIMLPILIGFSLFSYSFSKQISKLVAKLNEALSPSNNPIKEEFVFKRALEKYRPHVYETIKMIREESTRAESELNKRMPQKDKN